MREVTERLLNNDTVRELLLRMWDGDPIGEDDLLAAIDASHRVEMFLQTQLRSLQNSRQGGATESYNTAIEALVAWYSLPESERSTCGKAEMLADDRREMLKLIVGQLDACVLAKNLSSLLRMLWVATVNKDTGYEQQDLIGSLCLCAELAQLVAEADDARAQAEDVKQAV